MKRQTIFTVFFWITVKLCPAQEAYIDSLKKEVAVSGNDTANIILLEKIANTYSEINPDSAYSYAGRMIAITRKLNLRLEEVVGLGEMGYALLNMGNYPRSLQTLLSAIAIAEDPESEKNILPVKFPATDDFTNRSLSARKQRLANLGRILQYAGILYGNSNNYERGLYYYKRTIPLAEEANNLRILSITYSTMGRTYFYLKHLDSALLSLQKAYDYAIEGDYKRYLGSILLNLGRVYSAMKNQQLAKEYYQKALTASMEHNYTRGTVASNLALADIYKQTGNADSVFYYIQNGLTTAKYLNAPDLLLRSYTALSDFYKTTGGSDSVVKYQSLIIKINDSLFNSKQAQQFQNIDFDAQQREQEIQTAQKEYKNRIQKYMLFGGLAIFLLAVIFLWRSNKQRQKSNALLKKQNEEIEIAMTNLKTTQAQLIQSEKMASLGELTAGIAHEIQNPLNFVNNFSEVSAELTKELADEAGKGNTEEVKAIAKDLESNLEKINYHGKRAADIVKGMLQHSRAGSGQKELTDINELCDEYLRLAYHGLRAKDKSFNAKFETSFDETIDKLSIIPQDIGRVILNLINNAFYAVNARLNDSSGQEKSKQNIDGFEPTVTVATKKENGKIVISVKDNGNGIPSAIKEKIFQPFFTTKPTGQGTGLGLSLSYDIVTKGHGGELRAETKEGEGTTFTILLPANNN